jgi:hypothetical protein
MYKYLKKLLDDRFLHVTAGVFGFAFKPIVHIKNRESHQTLRFFLDFPHHVFHVISNCTSATIIENATQPLHCGKIGAFSTLCPRLAPECRPASSVRPGSAASLLVDRPTDRTHVAPPTRLQIHLSSDSRAPQLTRTRPMTKSAATRSSLLPCICFSLRLFSHEVVFLLLAASLHLCSHSR